MTRIAEMAPSENRAKAEDLADRIGPISTRADRVRIIRAWLEKERRRSLPPIGIDEILFGDV